MFINRGVIVEVSIEIFLKSKSDNKGRDLIISCLSLAFRVVWRDRLIGKVGHTSTITCYAKKNCQS